ncbi:hypothetical protein Tco_1020821, partial [Tanacetum coccineum]
ADGDGGGVLTEMMAVGRWRWQPAVGGGDDGKMVTAGWWG